MSLLLSEWSCPDHGVFELLTHRPPPDDVACPDCGQDSPWVISAPKAKVWSVVPTAVVRGGDTERRPGMLDTRPLAEGQSYKDWKAVQEKGRQERRHAELVKSGVISKRIQTP